MVVFGGYLCVEVGRWMGIGWLTVMRRRLNDGGVLYGWLHDG